MKLVDLIADLYLPDALLRLRLAVDHGDAAEVDEALRAKAIEAGCRSGRVGSEVRDNQPVPDLELGVHHALHDAVHGVARGAVHRRRHTLSVRPRYQGKYLGLSVVEDEAVERVVHTIGDVVLVLGSASAAGRRMRLL